MSPNYLTGRFNFSAKKQWQMVCKHWTSWTSSAISQLLEGRFTNQKSVPGKRKRQGRQIPGEQFPNSKWPPSIGENSQKQTEPAAPETGTEQGSHGEKTEEPLHTKGEGQQILCSFSPKRFKNWQQANLDFMFLSAQTVDYHSSIIADPRVSAGCGIEILIFHKGLLPLGDAGQ